MPAEDSRPEDRTESRGRRAVRHACQRVRPTTRRAAAGTALAHGSRGQEFLMLSNKVTFGVIALVAMVGAVGAGSWFASHGAPPAGKPAVAALTTPPST